MEKKINTGEVKCGFGVRKTYEGLKDFDQDYVSITIKKVFKKTGVDENGDEVGIEVDKVIEERKPIKDVVNADADNCGIDAYMKPYILTGTEPNVHFDKNAPIQDFSKLPQDLAASVDLSKKAAILFATLPDELKDGAKTMDEFFENLTQEKFMSYVDKHQVKVPGKAVEQLKKEGE